MKMKKLVHILMIIVLLVSTAGVTIDTHYCGPSFMGTTLMGHFYHQSDVNDMPSCCKMNKGCKQCKTYSNSYKVRSSFLLGQTFQLHSVLLYDGFKDLLSLYACLFVPNVTDAVKYSDTAYYSPHHDYHLVSSGGFRAPPFAAVFVANA